MIFHGRSSGIIHKFTLDVDPGYKYIEQFRGRVQWYKIESKDNISSLRLLLINENGNLVSVTFRLSIKEI